MKNSLIEKYNEYQRYYGYSAIAMVLGGVFLIANAFMIILQLSATDATVEKHGLLIPYWVMVIGIIVSVVFLVCVYFWQSRIDAKFEVLSQKAKKQFENMVVGKTDQIMNALKNEVLEISGSYYEIKSEEWSLIWSDYGAAKHGRHKGEIHLSASTYWKHLENEDMFLRLFTTFDLVADDQYEISKNEYSRVTKSNLFTDIPNEVFKNTFELSDMSELNIAQVEKKLREMREAQTLKHLKEREEQRKDDELSLQRRSVRAQEKMADKKDGLSTSSAVLLGAGTALVVDALLEDDQS